MKDGMREVQTQLKADLKHLRSAAPIEGMTFDLGRVILEDEYASDGSDWVSAAASSPEAAPEEKSVGPESTTAVREFFRCLWLWCVTSTNVSWKDIRSGRYQGSKKTDG